jgi:hypothetical protein
LTVAAGCDVRRSTPQERAMAISAAKTPPPSVAKTPHWSAVRGRAPALAGMSARMHLHVANVPSGVLLVEESGEVFIVEKGEAGCLIAIDTHETLQELLSGTLPPIVAHLQGRLRFEGDAELALRVLFGLQAGSPWASSSEKH